MTDNGTVRAARKAVARRLADALIVAGVDADAVGVPALPDLASGDLSWLTEETWTNAVEVAKVNDPSWHPAVGYTPSAQTRHLTATIIKYRLQADTEQDPFKGLAR